MWFDGNRVRKGALVAVLAAAWLAGSVGGADAAPAHHGDPVGLTPHPRWNGPGYRGPAIEPARDSGTIHVGTQQFPASGVSLLSWVPLAEYGDGSANANDCWGYVSPSGREYAIIGLEKSTGFVDVTNPHNPSVIAVVPDTASLWSDVETYGHYCLNVNEGGGGLQVMDLADIDDGVVTVAASLTASGLRTTHTLQVNPASGFVYLNGSNLVGGGLVAVDLADPLHPAIAGTWPVTYVHDCVARSYTSGPWAGREIVFACCGTAGLFIIDVTDKTAMATLAQLSYPLTGFCHNGWLDPEGHYLYINDEFDERFGFVPTSTTIMVDVSNIYLPVFVRKFTNGNTAVDHNPMGRGDFLYEANYRSGLRVYDISSLGSIHEVAWFDTWPEDDVAEFNGAWSTFVQLPSKVILISDIERGLFVVAHGAATGVPPMADDSRPSLHFIAGPNPFRDEGTMRFSLTAPADVSLRIADVGGREVTTLVDRRLDAGLHTVTWKPGRETAPGVYFATLSVGQATETKRIAYLR